MKIKFVFGFFEPEEALKEGFDIKNHLSQVITEYPFLEQAGDKKKEYIEHIVTSAFHVYKKSIIDEVVKKLT